MNEATFTPGPWTEGERNEAGVTLLAKDESEGVQHMVCRVYSHLFVSPDVMQANANLIAAAPELLDACEEALGALNGAEYALPGYVVQALERAIRKATQGEAR